MRCLALLALLGGCVDHGSAACTPELVLDGSPGGFAQQPISLVKPRTSETCVRLDGQANARDLVFHATTDAFDQGRVLFDLALRTPAGGLLADNLDPQDNATPTLELRFPPGFATNVVLAVAIRDDTSVESVQASIALELVEAP